MFRLKSNLPIMEIELTSLRPRFPEATFSIPFSFVSSGCNAEMKTYRHGMQEKHASFRYEITAECKFSNGNYRYNFCERMWNVTSILIPAEKLEIWTSREENASASTDFSYLGYITLSDNASTLYKSRELKSVALPETEALSLKLRLHKPHSNAHNTYCQVYCNTYFHNKKSEINKITSEKIKW